ncbi:MAG TPA: ABC transporter permease [Coriobacteriia bacterium]
MADAKPDISAVFAARVERYGGTLFGIVEEHRQFWKQIFQLAAADLVKTYRGSALGWLWALIKPSVTIFVYWFAFAIGLRASKSVNGFPFSLWLIAGILPWFYISEMLTQGTTTLKRYSYLVTKIKFPVSTIATFVSLSKFYVHLALSAIVIVIFIVFGYPVDVYYLQLPLYMALMFAFFTVWSMFAAPLSAISKDFANVVSSFVMAIFWMSGVMWDVNQIKNPWLSRLLLFNPVTFIATGYRNVFIYKRWFFQDSFALMAFGVTFTAMVLLTLFTYHRLRRDIADVL